jgi:hypothetical protein
MATALPSSGGVTPTRTAFAGVDMQTFRDGPFAEAPLRRHELTLHHIGRRKADGVT